MTSLSNRRTLRDKILLISSTVITLALLAIALVFSVYTWHQAKDSLGKDIKVLAKVIGNRSAAALVFSDVKSAQANLDSINLNKHVLKACLYSSNAQLFAAYSSDNKNVQCESQLENTRAGLTETRGKLRAVEVISDGGDTIGYIYLEATNQYIQQALQKGLALAMLAFFILLALAVGLLKLLIHRVLAPLSALHNTAQEISDNPFSTTRVPRVQDDDVGQLVGVFNAMLDKLGLENQALLSSENRFRLLAENSPVGIYQMDEDGRIVYANERWQLLTGLAAGATSKDVCRFLNNEDQDHYIATLQKIRSKHVSQVIEYRYTRRNEDRPCIFMEHVAALVEDVDGHKRFLGYIGSLMDISDLKDAQLELENLAFYDPLTNLPNRRFFRDHLQFVLASAKRNDKSVAMLMLDLDDFKKVNDTLGHDVGDQLLVALADRLRTQVAKRDVVSRMGGDEFMFLLNDVDVRSNIQNVAQRILQAIQQPVLIDRHELEVTASIGVAVYPDDAEDVESLIRNADLALYQSKGSGRNRVSFFSQKLETQINDKVRLERKIKEAIKHQTFTFYVQPQWQLSSKAMLSGEVLIRWPDPEEGMIPPDQFIPVAEETGLILDIGDWLIEEVIKSIGQHQATLKKLGLRSFAINLSAKQFYSSKLAANVRTLLEQYEVDARMLEFEITESVVMDDGQLAIEVMHQLKALGCRLSIDDFGTGYSSLAYLKKFPINAVKIDRSFISDIPHDQNDVEISAAIIAMAHNLGLDVVAEGVETDAQLQFLVEENCDIAQGYLIAKPMPFDQLLDLVEELPAPQQQDKEAGESPLSH
ncbi:MAG: EAL domain-containing protein [Oleiphilaceae bacterium]|nr:EAL domain-containing protein [Oleiphilaceae bacterium]